MINDVFSRGILVFGHRGFLEKAPENTMASFRLCKKLKVPGIELDVHVCKSGELVVAHDFKLKRITGQEGTIEEKTLSELRALDFGIYKGQQFKGEKIVRLDELFEEFGPSFIYDIELKPSRKFLTYELSKKVWSLVKRYNLEQNVLASSFNPFALASFNRTCHHRVPTGTIFNRADYLPKMFQNGEGRFISRSSYLKPHASLVDPSLMHKFKTRLGYPIVVWTVDDRSQALDLIKLGADGLIGNNPVMLMDVVRESGAKLFEN